MECIFFGEYRFDTSTHELKNQEYSVSLDPRMVALLRFFLANPNRIISRDELQQAIWQGVIVTDNAINKLVASLRKTLADDPKSPRYIQTVPKQGYRFIATVHTQDSLNTNGHVDEINTNTQPKSRNLAVKAALPVLICTVVVLLLLWQNGENGGLNYGENTVLTRVDGAKRSLVVAPKGNTVTFINNTYANGNELWHKRLDNNNDDVGAVIESKDYYFDSLIAQTANALIVKGYYQDQCGWFKVPFSRESAALTAPSAQVLDCESLISHRYTFDTQIESVWLLGHARNHEHRNRLYRINLNQGLEPVAVELPEQWQLVDLDLKPGAKNLLLVANNSEGQSRLYQVDLATGAAEPLIDVAQQLNQAIWGHAQHQLIYVSASKPAQLQMLNIQSGESQVIASLGDRLCCALARHPNEKDYIYSTYDKNIDIRWQNPGFELDNSNGNERLPAFAHTQPGIYFVSNRAGSDHIYFQAPGQRAQQIVPMSEHMVLNELAVSPDDRLAVVNHDNRQLWLVDIVEHGIAKRAHIDGYGFALSWLNPTLFSLTVKNQHQRRVRIYNRQMQLLAELDAPWVRILVDNSEPQFAYLINQSNELYRFSFSEILDGRLPEAEPIGEVASYSNAIIDNGVLYLNNYKEAQLSSYKINSASLQLLTQQPLNAYYGFDVENGQIVYGGTRAFSSDLYTTHAQ